MRTVYIDPDFRKLPKTEISCCRCQKDIKAKRYRMVHLLVDGITAVHPDDSHLVSAREDLGLHPIGNDCARKIGIEFTYEAQND